MEIEDQGGRPQIVWRGGEEKEKEESVKYY